MVSRVKGLHLAEGNKSYRNETSPNLKTWFQMPKKTKLNYTPDRKKAGTLGKPPSKGVVGLLKIMQKGGQIGYPKQQI